MKKRELNIGLFLFLCIILFSTNVVSQSISRITPQGERGSSFIQTIELTWATTPFYNYDTRVTVIGQPSITWQRVSDYDTGWMSYHRGRMTIPMDIPAGSYQVKMTNSAFPALFSWINISEFSVQVSTASPSVLTPGTSNVTLILTFSPPLKSWNYYQIFNVTSDNPGITYVMGSGKFLSANQLSIVVNISSDAMLGGLGLYIQYGIPAYVSERNPKGGISPHLQVTPQTSGDFAVIQCNAATSIIYIDQPNPTISAFTPSIISIDERNTPIDVTGSNFEPGLSFSTQHGGVTFSNTQYISATQAITYITVSPTSPLGDVAVTVTNPDGRSSTRPRAFNVVSKRPKFISTSNPVLIIGQTGQQVCISGENFYKGASIVFYSDYVHAREVRVLNSETICMLVDVDAAAQPGNLGVAIFNPDGAYGDEQNAFLLSYNNMTNKTILLLYPGAVNGLPFAVNEEDLNPVEIIDTQYPVFRWFSTAWRFRISIYKPLPGQTSFSEVVRNRPYYEQIVDGVNYFQYPLQARTLEPGVRYFWKVTAYFGTVPADYYTSGVDLKNFDDTTFQGERLESEVWSFVVRPNRSEGIEEFRFGTLNPVTDIAIEPRYVEVVPGDRVILELRGYDRNHNIAAFVPNLNMLSYSEMEKRYPDVKVLPKSFGRAELIVPGVKGDDDFRTRLLRNPSEFGRLPIMLYISKKAKGVCAILAVWQKHRFYAFVNVLPPKKTILENGQIDRFRIGSAERLAETFEIELDSPVTAGSVINGSGRLFIDAAGFREKGFLPVKVEDVRVDTSGRAYTGMVSFEGRHSVVISSFDIEIEKIGILPTQSAKIQGKLAIPGEKQSYKLEFDGIIASTGDTSAIASVNETIDLVKAEIPADSKIEIDLDSNKSTGFKKYSPEFRGLIVPLSMEDGKSKIMAIADATQLSTIDFSVTKKIADLKLDIKDSGKISIPITEDGIYMSALRNEDGSVKLNWQNMENGIRTFNVYRRAENEENYRLIAERVSTRDFIDKYVFSDVAYWYKLAGVNDQFMETSYSKPAKIQ